MTTTLRQQASLCLFLITWATSKAYTHSPTFLRMSCTNPPISSSPSSRRSFFSKTATLALTTATITTSTPTTAIGPIRLDLDIKDYLAQPCPPSKPIPGEKAMKGMRGLCVTVKADLKQQPPKNLDKVGVYGFVIDGITGNSVLANNPDLSTDAGQFAIVESVSTKDKSVEFEFVAAVPMERDLSKFDNGIGKLDFNSLRIVSFPGGQQYGGINPCEMDEFSMECDEWQEENGPFTRGQYMIKSNPRTKGR